MEKRTLIIGDIHGNFKGLIQCLEKSNYNSDEDKLIFLGDYVDGWSESAELIEYLIDLDSKAKYKSIFIRGNHDKWCEDWLINGQIHKIWQNQGGQSTIDSYIRTGYLVKDSHREFFKNMLNYYIDDKNRGFVHGGFNSRKGLGHEEYQSDYYWDRDLWNLAMMSHGRVHFDPENLVTDGKPASRRFERHSEIFIGHTATENYNCKPHYPEFEQMGKTNKAITVPMNRCNVWNLDTGSGWSGKLTIINIYTKEYWQSDYSKDLYPNERGR